MLNGTNLIKGRWKIIKAIGAGAFGACFLVSIGGPRKTIVNLPSTA